MFDYDPNNLQTFAKLSVNGSTKDSQTFDDVVYYHPLVQSETLAGAQLNTPSIGQSQRGDFYIGFIYEICLYATAKTDTNPTIDFSPPCNGGGYCSTCPNNEPTVCLINCEWNQYRLENGSCAACQPECTQGCVRPENCNTCLDPECEDCPAWTNDRQEGCVSCLNNADGEEIDNCTCNASFWFDLPENMCQPCWSTCRECYDSDQLSCTSCNPGYYLV